MAGFTIRFEAPFAESKAVALRDDLGQWLVRQGFPGETAGRVITALDELLCNTMEHSGAGWAEIAVQNRGSGLAVTFSDNGVAFDPSLEGKRDYAVYLQSDTDRHLGLYLISRLSSSMSYHRRDDGANVVDFTVGAEPPDPFRRLKRN